MKRIVLCAVLAPLLLFVVQAVTASLFLPPLPMPEGGGGLIVASALITAWVMVALAATLGVRGWRRIAILFFVAAGIPANNLLEGVFFSLDIPRAHLVPLYLYTLASGLIFAVLLDRMAGVPSSLQAPTASRTAGGWAARFAAADILYIACYFAAGVLVWPFVSHFYSERPLPSTALVAAMQVFRGLVFAVVVYTLMRFLALRPVPAFLLVAATFALVGGVAPLLVPNPYMPASIRFPHMAEVGVSNFVFGWIAAALLRTPRLGGG